MEENRIINATIVYSNARQRVVQDVVSTRVLQALLGTTLVLLVVNWVLGRGAPVLAGSPTSVATRAALVSGFLRARLLPRGAEWMGESELRGLLEGRRFWLGREAGRLEILVGGVGVDDGEGGSLGDRDGDAEGESLEDGDGDEDGDGEDGRGG